MFSAPQVPCIFHFYCSYLYISICYREFINPHPQEHAIQESIGNFTLAIDRSLRVECWRKTKLRIHFRHDVFRFLFQDREELTLDDFDSNYFPYGWNQWYRQYGRTAHARYCGRTIVFPIRVTCCLDWTGCKGFVRTADGTLQPKQRSFVEMIKVHIVKENC